MHRDERNPRMNLPLRDERAERATAHNRWERPRLASAVTHYVGSAFLVTTFPGVPLRSTPGFTLTPASRVSETDIRRCVLRASLSQL
jgi:hypothetical protein